MRVPPLPGTMLRHAPALNSFTARRPSLAISPNFSMVLWNQREFAAEIVDCRLDPVANTCLPASVTKR